LTLTSPRSCDTRDIIVVFRFVAYSWLAVRCASCSRSLTRPNPRLFHAADYRAEGAARSSKHVLWVCWGAPDAPGSCYGRSDLRVRRFVPDRAPEGVEVLSLWGARTPTSPCASSRRAAPKLEGGMMLGKVGKHKW
jgi:hypothetical protein